jgi:hypothetical protein
MTEISSAYPKIRIEAPGVPEPLLEDVTADAMKDFFRESECWRYTVPGLLDWTTALVFPALAAGTEIPAGTRVKRVDEVKYASDGVSLRKINFHTRQDLDDYYSDWEVKTGNTPLVWTNDPTSDNPRIIPIAQADVTGSIKVRAILVPTTLTDIPDFFYDEFHDAWRWGALARLLKMPDRDWTNNALAIFYQGKYDDEIERAKSRAQAEFGQPNQRTMAYGGL